MQPFQFLDILIRHLEKEISAYYEAETYKMCWNYHFPFVFCIIKKKMKKKIKRKEMKEKKKRWNSDIQNFYSKIVNFRLFFEKKSQFSGPACFYDVITT